MKKYIPYAIVGAVCLTWIIVLGGIKRAHRLDFARAQFKYEQVIKEKDMLFKEKKENIQRLEHEISIRTNEVASGKETILTLEEVIRKNNIALDELREAEPEGEETLLVINLRGQIGELVKQFSICRKQGAEYHSIVFSLTEKYEAQLKITEDYKAMLFKETEAHSISKMVSKEYARRLKTLQLESVILKSALLASIIGVVYLLLN